MRQFEKTRRGSSSETSPRGRVNRGCVARAFVAVAVLSIGLAGGIPRAAGVIGTAQSLNSFRFEGGGWGHGVGLSQYGAYGMAQNGASAGQILAKYYQGTELRQLAQPSDVRIWLGEVSGADGVRFAAAGFGIIGYQASDGRVVAND